jgi:hypothetical protein
MAPAVRTFGSQRFSLAVMSERCSGQKALLMAMPSSKDFR